MSRYLSLLCLLFVLFSPSTALSQEEDGDAPAGVSEEAAEALGEDRGKTEEEQLEEILSSQQNDYDLISSGNLKINYDANYSYNSNPRGSLVQTDTGFVINEITRDSRHTLNQTISLRYGYYDYLTTGINIPIVAKLNSATDQSVSAFGDVSLSTRYQPYVVRPGQAKVTVSSSLNLPTGRSSFEIDREEELSTGNGLYGLSAGMNISKTFDPVVAFGNLGIAYSLPKDDINQRRQGNLLLEVEPGPSISGGMGMAWSLSYDVSITYSLSYSLGLPGEVTSRNSNGNVVTTETNATTTAVFNLSSGWRISPRYQMTVGLGMGLTENSPDFSINVGFPLVLETPDIL